SEQPRLGIPYRWRRGCSDLSLPCERAYEEEDRERHRNRADRSQPKYSPLLVSRVPRCSEVACDYEGTLPTLRPEGGLGRAASGPGRRSLALGPHNAREAMDGRGLQGPTGERVRCPPSAS